MKAHSITKKLQFLSEEQNGITERLLKADMLLHAIHEKDEEYAKEILNSPGNNDYINFRMHDRTVTDIEGREYQRYYGNDSLENLPRTPLTLACYYGQIDVVRLLLEKKAHVNLTSNNYSPLEYAVIQRKFLDEEVPLDHYKKIVSLLLMNGATYSNTLQQFDEDHVLPQNPPSLKFLETTKIKVPSLQYPEDEPEVEETKSLKV